MMSREQHTAGLRVCSVRVADRVFGLDARHIVEVLGQRRVRRVPHAPSPVAGILAHRGEVLTTLCLRRSLGYQPLPDGESCAVMLAGPLNAHGEPKPFGLLVDEVGTLLDWRGELLCGVEGLLRGLLFELHPCRLHEQPSSHEEVAA
jgi:chemotaxis signal transduction protein